MNTTETRDAEGRKVTIYHTEQGPMRVVEDLTLRPGEVRIKGKPVSRYSREAEQARR